MECVTTLRFMSQARDRLNGCFWKHEQSIARSERMIDFVDFAIEWL